jgi:hypothetical protein
MPRIRSIKPETWSDQKLARLSRDARLLYVALWNFADEQARMVGDPRQVKGMCLSMDDDLTPVEVDLLLDDLAKAGRVVRYIVDDEHFLFLPHLPKHQRLDTAQESRFPAPPDNDSAPPPQNSGESPDKSGEVSGESGEVRPRARAYVAGSREQVAGSKETVVEQARPLAVIPGGFSDDPADILDVWDAWKSSTGKQRCDFSPARRQAIVKALNRYPLADVLDAVRGHVNDPWPERPQHNDITQLLHMGTARKPLNVLEKMRDLWRDGPPHQVSKQTAQAIRTSHAMRARAEEVNGDLRRVGRSGGPAERGLPTPAD